MKKCAIYTCSVYARTVPANGVPEHQGEFCEAHEGDYCESPERRREIFLEAEGASAARLAACRTDFRDRLWKEPYAIATKNYFGVK